MNMNLNNWERTMTYSQMKDRVKVTAELSRKLRVSARDCYGKAVGANSGSWTTAGAKLDWRRKHILRKELRSLNLAKGFLKGHPYLKIESTARTWPDSSVIAFLTEVSEREVDGWLTAE